MTGNIREPARSEHFLGLIWLTVLVRIAWPEAKVTGLATGLMVAFVILALARLRRLRHRTSAVECPNLGVKPT